MCPPQITSRSRAAVNKLSGSMRVPLLHQVEHPGKGRLEFQRLLDLICGDKRILTVFQKARALVFTNEPNECWSICLPVLWKSFEVFKDSVQAILGEQRYCVF